MRFHLEDVMEVTNDMCYNGLCLSTLEESKLHGNVQKSTQISCEFMHTVKCRYNLLI